MKLTSLLLAASVCSAHVAQAPELTIAQQLLETLGPFPSADPLISVLIASIQKSSQVLDTIIADNSLTRQSLLASTARSWIACQMLKAILPSYHTDSASITPYNTLRTKNWSSNCDLPAACFLTPVHSAQVAVSLQVIALTHSKFAVRSGGHNPNPGFAGVGVEGVTIDTQGFSTLQLNAEKTVATVGAGLRFGAVQTFMDQNGVAVVSGRNKDVGVAGLLLGGGHPIINSLTGLAADNIESAEVVLSTFKVVTASQTQNSDLFRALKGGGNNFGIVTSFKLKTKQPRNIWYRIAVYPNTNPRPFFDALVDVQQRMESDPNAGIAVTASPIGFTVSFVYGAYTKDPEVFTKFRALTPTAEPKPATNGTTLEFIALQSPLQGEASRDTVGVTTYPNVDLYVDIYSKYLTAAAANGGPTSVFLLSIQTFGSASVQIAGSNGGNVLGTSARAQTWFNPIAQWTNPADDAKVHKTLIDLAFSITSAAQAKGLYDKYIFANIAAREQKVLAGYGQANLDFLKAMSKKYDVLQVFQNLQNGGFLVSKA